MECIKKELKAVTPKIQLIQLMRIGVFEFYTKRDVYRHQLILKRKHN